MRLWSSILATLQIIAGGSVLLEFVETRWVGLFSLVVAAMQAGTVFYMRSGEPEHVAKHAVVDAEGRTGLDAYRD